MRDKTAKLAGQYESRYDRVSGIFSGKTFWSTGRLEGVDADIKQIITENGGDYEQYGFRNVSHIIASNVALSNQNWKKLLGGKFTSKSYKMVTPQWIFDSVEAGKPLPESDYLPECIRMKGTLEAFLSDNDRQPSSSSNLKESTAPFTTHESFARRSRFLKVSIQNPTGGIAIAEEICFEFLNALTPLARRGFITTVHPGGVSVHSLNFSELSTALSDALIREFTTFDWPTIATVSVSLCMNEPGQHELDIFPTSSDEVNPSSVRGTMAELTQSLVNSDEDSVHLALTRSLHEVGACMNAIFLDAFQILVASRRLDSARNMLKSLRQICYNTDDMDLMRWVDRITETALASFSHSNGGAVLNLA